MISKNTLVLLGFVLLKLILQYQLINPVYELHRDEYLHLDQANHLAWGYISLPPFTSWMSVLIKWLGNSEFWVKFFPALFGAATLVVVWKTISFLGGNFYAKVLGATGVLFSILLRINTLYQPNSFDIFFWTVVSYFVIKYLYTQHSKWLLLAGIFFGIGVLNKYNIVFMLLAMIPAIAISSERKVLFKREFFLSLGLALLIIAPNIIWQFTHDFPVLTHLNELADKQLVNVQRIDFLKSQLVFFLGSLIVILAGLYALLKDAAFKPIRFLFWSFLFVLLLFTYLRAKDYYAIGLYPVYVGIGAVFLGQKLKGQVGTFLKPVLLVLPILVFGLAYNYLFPNKSPEYIIENQEEYRKMGLLRWEDGIDHDLPQDFADMLGWKELALKIDQAYLKTKQPESTLVLCDNYGQAGAINFYSHENVRAVTFNADYVNWFDLKRSYKHLIRVINSSEKTKEFKETGLYFEESFVSDSITNIYARELGTGIYVFNGPKIDINQAIQDEIDHIKKKTN